jgi:hypothetical protein
MGVLTVDEGGVALPKEIKFKIGGTEVGKFKDLNCNKTLNIGDTDKKLTVTGYDLILDDGVMGIDEVVVNAGETVQCTFTNEQSAMSQIIVTKMTNPETTDEFTLKITTVDGEIMDVHTKSLRYGESEMWPVMSGHSYTVMDITENSGYVVMKNSCVGMTPEPGHTMDCTIMTSLVGADTTKEKIQSTLDILENIPDLGNNKANGKLAKAIEHIDKSLDDNLWVDGKYLDDQDGKKVFHEVEKGVKELLKIQKESDTCTDVTEISLKYVGVMPDVYIKFLGYEGYNESKEIQVPRSDSVMHFGESVVLDNGSTPLGSDTDVEIHYYDGDKLHMMEAFTIHTSCSTPITVHDIHGTLAMHPDFVPVVPVSSNMGSVEIDGLSVLDDDNGSTIDPNIMGDLLSASYAFVAIDRQLTDTSMLQAHGYDPGNGKYDKEMEKSMKDMKKGDNKRDDGKLDKAIHHYEKAWQHAQKAMKEVT